MSRRTPEEARRIAESLGPAEKLVQLIVNFPDHLWHNRPGVVREGKWKAATRKEIDEHKKSGRCSTLVVTGCLSQRYFLQSAAYCSGSYCLCELSVPYTHSLFSINHYLLQSNQSRWKLLYSQHVKMRSANWHVHSYV